MDKHEVAAKIKKTKWKYALVVTKLDMMRAAYSEGASTNDIAKHISELIGEQVKRRAIIGMYHRYRGDLVDCPLAKASSPNGLPKGSVSQRVYVPKSKPKIKESQSLAPKRLWQLFDDNTLKGSLVDIEHGQCRWPVNKDTEPFVFCGFLKYKNSSYCEHHTARAWASSASKADSGAEADLQVAS